MQININVQAKFIRKLKFRLTSVAGSYNSRITGEQSLTDSPGEQF